MYKMLIVDDESYIGEQLSALIDWHSINFDPVGIFDNYTDALAYMQKNKIDVLLTDIRLGEQLGLDLVREARQIHPELETILISAFSEFSYAHDAISLNVFEYLLKPISLDGVKDCFTRLGQKMAKKISDYQVDIPSNAYYIKLVKSYIDEHYNEDLSLDSVAAKLSLNAKYLSHYFKQQTNENLTRYLSRVRIREAIELLKDSSVKLSSIYQRVGYQSKSQFYDVFIREIGYTPADYRNKLFGAGNISLIRQSGELGEAK